MQIKIAAILFDYYLLENFCVANFWILSILIGCPQYLSDWFQQKCKNVVNWKGKEKETPKNKTYNKKMSKITGCYAKFKNGNY